MTSSKSVSFRSSLVSTINDLLKSANLKCLNTIELVTGLVSRLAAYTEEGTPLSPSVYICNSIDELVKRAGVGEYVQLGKNEDIENLAPEVLKVCAPLCFGIWKIYVERNSDGTKYTYGVFSGSNDLTALSVDEVLMTGFDSDFPIIRVSQSVTNKVEVLTNADDVVEFHFSDAEDAAELIASREILGLSNSISNRVINEQQSFSELVMRVLGVAIRRSHGTLIGVCANGKIPDALTDAVILNRPIALSEKYQNHLISKTPASMSDLQIAAELIEGFIQSDGITLFSDDGQLLGYRSFIKSEIVGGASGGARTRAFEAMAKLVGTDLSAAFFRSQDGRTKFKGTSNG